jgi:DNA-binding transcriptional LysR family regulator
MSVELPHLRYVAAAAEHRSFQRAASALNITQPTLSKRIRELENRLGVLLFERTTGGVHLTAQGEDVLAVAKRVLTDIDGMENYAKATKAGDAGHLRIGFYTALAGPLRDTVVSFGQQPRNSTSISSRMIVSYLSLTAPDPLHAQPTCQPDATAATIPVR